MRGIGVLITVSLVGNYLPACAAGGPEPPAVGVAKIDITPAYPIRLSGFGFRRTESDGVSQRIWAKALAIDDGEPAVLIAVDNLGVPAYLVNEVARRLATKGVKRERFAITATHTHTAPMLTHVAPTLFGMPIPGDQQKRIDRYTRELADGLEKVALSALADRKAARLSWGIGRVGFARNRRTKGGPVDHDLPVLAVRDLDGKLRAVYVNYACHCVTLSHNKISGDWAGYAQELIEQEFPGAIALVSIGCGGDQNPSSGVTGGKLDIAARQGDEIAREVKRLLGGFLAPVSGKMVAAVKRFDLPLDTLPTRQQWEGLAKKKGAIGYHARVNLARLDRGEKLPTKIPYSVQTWSFGDALALVFLPGELVVDYATRLKRELDRRRLWINAYANDAPCYIPSERILKEGGYEGGGAMVYYDLPTRLKAGLENTIVAAVHEQIGKRFSSPFDPAKTGGSLPQSPQQSLAAIRTKKDLVVDLVAAEPLVTSPVAIAWGPDGRLWVAEMYDYPTGIKGDYKPGGRIKLLEKTGRGREADVNAPYDKATVFLDNIPFPTGVTVWGKGVLVCAAPDILYAEDSDGDGKADVVRKLFSGFGTHNYQARVNSLEYGLDNWIYGSCGLFGGNISSSAGGPPVALGDRDFRIRTSALPGRTYQGRARQAGPALEPATGRTQQGRVRDDWGSWFGCDNSTLCRHYPLADHYLRRNPHVAAPPAGVLVPEGPEPNRLYPIQHKLQLFKLSGLIGRTTAACGLGIYRDDLLGTAYQGNVFMCEPVNLLVHRLKLEPRGSTCTGRRPAGEEKSEFLASTDTWFRPVQARTGPDGALWIIDMYRYVIEHPRWIPPADLARVDLRAGSNMGRIYRVRPRDKQLRPIPRLDKLDTPGLVAALDSPNGCQRDLATQMLLDRKDEAAIKPLEDLIQNSTRAEARLHALCTLDGLGKLEAGLVRAALSDVHPGVRRHALRLSEKRLNQDPLLGPALFKRISDPDAQVRLQLAYSLGEWRSKLSGQALAVLAVEHRDDPYLTAAVLSSVNKENVGDVLTGVFSLQRSLSAQLTQRLLEIAIAFENRTALPKVLLEIVRPREGGFAAEQMNSLAQVMDFLERRGRSIDQLIQSGGVNAEGANYIRRMLVHARALAAREDAAQADRLAAIKLLGRTADHLRADVDALGRTLVPQSPPPVQIAALAALGRIPQERVADILTAGWKSYTPALKNQALDLLLSRPSWQPKLLDSIEKNVVPAASIDASRRQRLLNHKDARIRARAAKVLAGSINPDRQKILKEYGPAATMAGDVTRGQAVFAKRCAVCHQLNGMGHAVGPDLAPLADKTPLYLLTEILDPNRNIDSRYVDYVAVTRSGKIITGLLASESATSITLRGQEGKEQTLLRAELESLASTGRSLMPEGMEKDVSKQEMADLLRYLRTRGSRSGAFLLRQDFPNRLARRTDNPFSQTAFVSVPVVLCRSWNERSSKQESKCSQNSMRRLLFLKSNWPIEKPLVRRRKQLV